MKTIVQKQIQRISKTNILTQSLLEGDREMYDLIKGEEKRQRDGINLIASENFSSKSVKEAIGSVLTNKYSEGYPGQRYYGGTKWIDKVESLCQKRALETFRVSDKEWGVNVQTLSGSPANFAVYTGLLDVKDRIMSLDLTHGGHLSHGFQIPGKKISATSKYFEVLPYHLDIQTGLIDYEEMERMARIYRPKMIIAGTSAYSRLIDYERVRKLCDEINCVMLADMAHISGLVAGDAIPSPFQYADVVTTTTHKSLRGPRSSMVFYRVGLKKIDKKGKEIHYDYKSKIDQAVFPGLQGGPHNHTIGALAVALKQAQTDEFREYQQQVLINSKQMAQSLLNHNFELVSGGTDNHLVLVDLRSKGVDGSSIEVVLEQANIYINKNTVPGDKRALLPSGMRLGSHAMTTRGCGINHFQQIVKFIDHGTTITRNIRNQNPKLKQDQFKQIVLQGNSDIEALQKDVLAFAQQLPSYT